MAQTNTIGEQLTQAGFLVYLGVFSSLASEVLSCPMKKFLQDSVAVKHFTLLFVIYVALGNTGKFLSPADLVWVTIVGYVGFLMWSRMLLPMQIAVILALMALYITNYSILYTVPPESCSTEECKTKRQNAVDTNARVNLAIGTVIAGIIVLGFGQYAVQRIGKYGYKRFDIIKFLFGSRRECGYKRTSSETLLA